MLTTKPGRYAGSSCQQALFNLSQAGGQLSAWNIWAEWFLCLFTRHLFDYIWNYWAINSNFFAVSKTQILVGKYGNSRLHRACAKKQNICSSNLSLNLKWFISDNFFHVCGEFRKDAVEFSRHFFMKYLHLLFNTRSPRLSRYLQAPKCINWS